MKEEIPDFTVLDISEVFYARRGAIEALMGTDFADGKILYICKYKDTRVGVVCDTNYTKFNIGDIAVPEHGGKWDFVYEIEPRIIYIADVRNGFRPS